MTEFNVGDVVRCKSDVEGEFTKGNLYQVSSVSKRKGSDRLHFDKDDSGNKNGWDAQFFELVRRKGEFKVGDIVNWKDDPYWQNATVRKVEGTKVYADSKGKNTVSGEGLFYQNEEYFELTLVKPVTQSCLTFKANGQVVFEIGDFYVNSKNHELTVNEARSIADELDDSIVNVIAVYDELIKRGFKITKD